MKQLLIILYVPGLGDHNPESQAQALRLWHIYGVTAEICPMNWLVDEPWGAKLQRLLNRIDMYATQGKTISLVGTSAGSNAVLQALVRRNTSIQSVALICPKFQYPETVHPSRYRKNPAFKSAIDGTIAILPSLSDDQKRKLMVFRPPWDDLLPAKESHIPGVRVKIMPAITHVGAIAYAITLGSWRIVRFLKKPS